MSTSFSSTPTIALFGGQGSLSVFSSSSASVIEDGIPRTLAGAILLSRCHTAFLEEIGRLEEVTNTALAIDTTCFSRPQDLLRPPTQYHTHAVIQATTIYLCQILNYLAETVGREKGNVSNKSESEAVAAAFEQLLETSGFCSGLIPATVVARSRTLDEFMAAAVEGFRLVFWIAINTRSWSHAVEAQAAEDTARVGSWSLVIWGLSQDAIEDQLFSHIYGEGKIQYSQSLKKGLLRVSAVSREDIVSVSGPASHLLDFQAHLNSKSSPPTSKFAHVHAWYHGGDQLQELVNKIVQDAKIRRIIFPPCKAPKPVRSSFDASLHLLFAGDEICDNSSEDETQADLVPWLVEHLIIKCVNWTKTIASISARIQQPPELREGQHAIEHIPVNVLAFGPASETLFPISYRNSSKVNFLDLSPFTSANKSRQTNHQNSIAIVGMSIHLPKGNGSEELWDTLHHGLNAVQEIPESRFMLSDYYSDLDSKTNSSRSMSTRHGSFLDDPFSFDNSFFSISPREAASMDPQQRLLLHAAQDALDDAGYVGDATPSFQRATTGCYIGLATGDYTDNLRENIDVFYSPGTLRAFHSGRISYVYKLSGPSIVTDTACSSSIVSIYQACRALQSGECTSALAGGVNVISSPDMYLGLSRSHFLSPTGNCKPFDASADGYGRGEGCVVFVLKRLSDAIAENDRIHGVIRDVMINQSGNAHSITHPHSESQIHLFQSLLRKCDVDIGSISVIEAHGTGTQAGDAREIESLKTVFGTHHSRSNPLTISSIKGNIGHCEAASGAAGLAKLLLMLRKKMIPLQAGLKQLSPHLVGLQNSSFVIPTETMPWINTSSEPRRAMLNNFGAAGSNTALLLEEWIEPNCRQLDPDRSAYVFMVSAKSQSALKVSLKNHLDSIEQSRNIMPLRDICYTATARRKTYDYCVALSCTSLDDLLSKLRGLDAESVKSTEAISGAVFVFSGQGGIFNGMAIELMQSCPHFTQSVMRCEQILQTFGFPSILSFFQKRDSKTPGLDYLDEIIASQCACVSLEYSLAQLFMAWGVIPDYVVGHSLGEYAALCISGALTLEDTLRVVASRARLMTVKCEPQASGMLACKISSQKAQNLISQSLQFANLSISCHNGADDSVIGGPLDEINKLEIHCKQHHIKSKKLDVPYAFHSMAMDPIILPLHDLGQSVSLKLPRIPVVSNALGRLLKKEDLHSEYFASHARQPVRFADGLSDLESKNMLSNRVFLEIGPHPSTLPLLNSWPTTNSSKFVPTLRKGQDAWTTISTALAELSLLKFQIPWREVFAGSSAKVANLPSYPLAGLSYITPYRDNGLDTISHDVHTAHTRRPTGYSLLPWQITTHSTEDFLFETTMSNLAPLILGHKVGGSAICPASVFYELALEGTQIVLSATEKQDIVISNVLFTSPAVYTVSQDSKIVTLSITKQDTTGSLSFRITSGADKSQLHCTGSVTIQNSNAMEFSRLKDKAYVTRQIAWFALHSRMEKSPLDTFRTKAIYEAVFTRVVQYASQYQSLIYLSVAESNLESFGSFKLPAGSRPDMFPPVFTDTLLHTAGFTANLAVGSDEICICASIESVELLYHSIDFTDTFTIYSSLIGFDDAYFADAIALNSAGDVVAIIRGIEFKKLRLNSFQRLLLAQSSTQEPHMTPLLSTNGSTPVSQKSPVIAPNSQYKTQEINESIRSIILNIGGFSSEAIDHGKTLDELGFDSLMLIEVVSKLQSTYPESCKLDHNTLSGFTTLISLENALVSALQLPDVYISSTNGGKKGSTIANPAATNERSVENPVNLHRSETGLMPLCLFHDGSGQVSMYARLKNNDRDTYGMLDPYFGKETRPYDNLEKMTEGYVTSILSTTNSPIIVGGWSFGGVLAFEATQKLIAAGHAVKGLVLIDSPSPINHQALPKEIIAKISQTRNSQTSQVEDVGAKIKREFEYCASLLEKYEPKYIPAHGNRFKTIYLQSCDLFNTQKICGVQYDWLSSQDSRDSAITAWEGLVGGNLEVLPIPGNHFEAFLPDNISETAAQIWKACRLIEGSL